MCVMRVFIILAWLMRGRQVGGGKGEAKGRGKERRMMETLSYLLSTKKKKKKKETHPQ